MFFVGAYRSNEVDISHDMFNLIERLDISNVHMTKVSLSGLNSHDLNTMISDALCLYPRICKSLSSIVYQKTKGNPFFVLEFMQSLLSRGLLRYNFHQKRWVWNEDMIRAEGITDNVLHLLALKMNGLSDDVQVLLKVMACCGTSTDESVIRCLSESVEYPGLQDGLDKAVSDGFIEKDGEGSFKFVHDKVREAAYNLIPESEKKQVSHLVLFYVFPRIILLCIKSHTEPFCDYSFTTIWAKCYNQHLEMMMQTTQLLSLLARSITAKSSSRKTKS